MYCTDARSSRILSGLETRSVGRSCVGRSCVSGRERLSGCSTFFPEADCSLSPFSSIFPTDPVSGGTVGVSRLSRRSRINRLLAVSSHS